MTNRLIFASGSSYKIGQLKRLDVPFHAVDADIDERAFDAENIKALAILLAIQKAKSLQAEYPEDYILGADQIISVDGIALHKPGHFDGCCQQLEQLQGRKHDLHCAIALITPDKSILHADVIYEMHMRPLNTAQIEAYVSKDKPYDCSGSYKLESYGIRLFQAMKGDDYTAIIGLPLTRVYDLLEESGYLEQATP